MAGEAEGGSPKKLTTQEILARLRAEKSGGAAPPPAESAPPPAAASAPEPAPPAAAPPPSAPSPAAKPKSTADILAAARAQKAGGAAPAPAAPTPAAASASPAGGAPKSTADILAAARAQKAAGTAPAGAAPAAGAAKPKSTADILAAARAAKAAGAPIETVATAAAPATGPTTTVDTAHVPVPSLSVQEMLAAVRPTGPTGKKAEVAAPRPPVKPAGPPPAPAKPAPAAKRGAVEQRRGFFATLGGVLLSPFALGWICISTASAAALLGTARFMLPNVLTEPPRKFKIGPPTDYDLGTVATKWVAAYGVWVVHTDQYRGRNMIYALASVCTHLGCTPSWLEGEQKFKCPCHGSGFYITGVNFEGPAPRPLERVGIRVSEDGMLEVDKSLKFQEEMGQWADGNSYVEVS